MKVMFIGCATAISLSFDRKIISGVDTMLSGINWTETKTNSDQIKFNAETMFYNIKVEGRKVLGMSRILPHSEE